jgi:thiamine-phosphate pyrophosphorylase
VTAGGPPARLPSRLYLIVDPLDTGRDPLVLARAMLAGGARLLQLRLKRDPQGRPLATGVLLRHAAAIREVTAAAGATFVVNDRADVAAAVHADGVHLGQEDLPVAAARAVVGAAALIGLSTHDETQLAVAGAAGADYLSFGPIYPTTSKVDPDPTIGYDRLRAARATTRHPLVAIGGITAATLPAVLAAGATAAAVISAVVRARDVERATADLLARADRG